MIQLATHLVSLVSVLPLEARFEASPIMGMLRFSRPSMYIFPEGAGDACLLGVYGFSLLVDTGASKDPAFWNFIRHVDRIDAVMITHWSSENLLGLTSFAERQSLTGYQGPPIGCFLGPPGPAMKASVRARCCEKVLRHFNLISRCSQGRQLEKLISQSAVGIFPQKERVPFGCEDLRSCNVAIFVHLMRMMVF